MCDYFKRLVVYCDGRRRIRSTPRKEDADGAHNEDPPPDDAADGSTTGTHHRMEPWCLVSCIFPSWFLSHQLIHVESLSAAKFQSLGAETQPAWGTTPQMEAPPDGAVMSSELHISFILLVKVAHNPLRKVEFRYIISNKMLSEKVKKFKYVLGNYVDS